MQTDILKNRWVVRFGFLLFGITAFLGFFYTAFPFDLLQEKMVLAFKTETNCEAHPKDHAVHFPLRFQWHQVQVICPKAAPFVLEFVEADLATLPILFKQQGEVAFKINFAGQQGEVTGFLVASKTSNGFSFSLKKGGGKFVSFNHRGFSGILDLSGSSRWEGQGVLQGAGAFDFTLKDVHIKDQAWAWPLSDIAFAAVHGKVSWKNGVFSIGNLSAEGELATLKSDQGKLILHDPFSESFVSVTINIFPRGQLQQVAAMMIPGYSAAEPLTLAVSGALTLPKVLLNGRRLGAAS
jgi:type II secretion system protein N